MHSEIVGKTLKATIIHIIVALFITGIISGAIKLFVGKQIEENISLINKVSIGVDKKDEDETKEIKLVRDEETNVMKNIPEYGEKFATIQIPKIDVDLPVYRGDTLEVLKKGVGFSTDSYYPGQGGSIILMGHNSKKVFRRFSELQEGNEVTIKTSYGDFKYKIYDMQVIKETDLDKVPIQNEEEKLMIYTCYPFNNIGYTTQRYVVYANLEK